MVHSFYTTHLIALYGEEQTPAVAKRLQAIIEHYRKLIRHPDNGALSEKDAMLISYPDQVQEQGEPPLTILSVFCEKYLKEVISSIHLLPFYPWSSDDGFAVKDYLAVDPALGNWDNISRLGESFRLMFDAVINHASTQGDWFQAFLHDEEPYREFFITIECNPDLSQVVRPRSLPFLHEYQTRAGKRHVWTTFSADQADLDYHNPDVLLTMVKILLEYVAKGAFYLRLDAIAYLWKEIGTSCIHLSQTHTIVQLLRAVLEDVAPFVRLITETNVPHKENLSYFGDGSNEAHLVYNFALPPLVLHTFLKGDSTTLSDWASKLETPSSKTCFFNFLASHDGIGINPVRGILQQADIDHLVETTLSHGGRISYSQKVNSSPVPYELNINYFDALSDPKSDEPSSLQVKRFLAAQAIMLSLRGLPGIYFHSLFGSRNWYAGVEQSGQYRRINREKIQLHNLEKELLDPSHIRSQVFQGYCDLLWKRKSSTAFHPSAQQEIVDMGESIFALIRTSCDKSKRVLCIHNITSEIQTAGNWTLSPYQVLWIANP